MLIAIWAQDEQGLIGKENRLPWHLPNDLQFFKKQTMNQTIVMGRKTFEGMNKRALPHRQTIVLTSDQNYQAENVIIMHSVADVLAFANTCSTDVFITGGANIYQQFLPSCYQILRTVIHAQFSGDAYFPKVDWKNWVCVESRQGALDEKNQYPHTFETYRRNYQ